MAKRKKGRPIQVEARDEREARVMEAARRAYRLAKEKLHEARDPASSKEAYEAVWEATDDIGKAMVESVEEEEAEEDPDLFGAPDVIVGHSALGSAGQRPPSLSMARAMRGT